MNKELSDLLMLYHSNRTRATVPRSTPMPVITFNGVSVFLLLLLSACSLNFYLNLRCTTKLNKMMLNSIWDESYANIYILCLPKYAN